MILARINLYFMDQYWQSQIDPFTQAARNIGQRLAMQPQLKAMAALRQQQAIYQAAHAQQAQAAAELASARTQQITKQGQGEQDMVDSGNRLALALRTLATKPNDPDATASAVSEMGHYFVKNPQEAANGLRTLVTTLAARAGGTPTRQLAEMGGDADKVYSTDQDNATQLQLNAANNKTKMEMDAAEPVVLPSGSTMATKTGNVLAQAAATVGQGGTRFAPVASADENEDSSLDVEGTGVPPNPTTPAGQVTRANLIRALLEKSAEGKMTRADVNAAVKTYDAHMKDLAAAPQGAVPAVPVGNVRSLASSLATRAQAPAVVPQGDNGDFGGETNQPSSVDEGSGSGSGSAPGAPAAIPVYPDEASARADGNGSQSVVRIRGVGTVRLR